MPPPHSQAKSFMAARSSSESPTSAAAISARGLGVGRALITAAERWAADRGYRELASDTQWDNDASVAAHQALGFEPAGVIRCFRKRLHAHAAPAHHPQP